MVLLTPIHQPWQDAGRAPDSAETSVPVEGTQDREVSAVLRAFWGGFKLGVKDSVSLSADPAVIQHLTVQKRGCGGFHMLKFIALQYAAGY